MANKYYPFGMTVPNRSASSTAYRYSFQGQEKDDELKGEGNSINYKFRMHDPRVGRFFAVDPLSPEYPWYTPYSFSGNKVIAFVELEGLEEKSLDDMWNDVKDLAKPFTSGEILEGPKESVKDFLRVVKNIPSNIEKNIEKRRTNSVGTLPIGVQPWVDSNALKQDGVKPPIAPRDAKVFDVNFSGFKTIFDSMPFDVGETIPVVDNANTITSISDKAEEGAKALGTSRENYKKIKIYSLKWGEMKFGDNQSIDTVDLFSKKDTLVLEKSIKPVESKNKERRSNDLKKLMNNFDKYEREQDSLTQENKC